VLLGCKSSISLDTASLHRGHSINQIMWKLYLIQFGSVLGILALNLQMNIGNEV